MFHYFRDRTGAHPEGHLNGYAGILTARLNDFDPQAWLADVLARINDHRITEIDALLPWRWAPAAVSLAA